MSQTIKTAAIAFALAATTASAFALPTQYTYTAIETDSEVLTVTDTSAVFTATVDSIHMYGITIYAAKAITVKAPTIAGLEFTMVDSNTWSAFLKPAADSANLEFNVSGSAADTVCIDVGYYSPIKGTVFGTVDVPAMATFGVAQFISKPSVKGEYIPAGKTKAKKVSFPVITKVSKKAPATVVTAELKSKVKLYSPKAISTAYKAGKSLADSEGTINPDINTNIVMELVAKLKKDEKALGQFEIAPPALIAVSSTDTVVVDSMHNITPDSTLVDTHIENAIGYTTVVTINIYNQGVKIVKPGKFATTLKGWIEIPQANGKIKKVAIKFDKEAEYNSETDVFTVKFSCKGIKKQVGNLWTNVVIDNGVGLETFPIMVLGVVGE